MITVVHAALISDRLWHINRPKFHRECAVARELGITLLELIQRRIATRLGLAMPYEKYEVAI